MCRHLQLMLSKTDILLVFARTLGSTYYHISVIIRRPVRFLLSFSEIIKMATRGRKKRVVTQTEEQNSRSYSNAMRTKFHSKLSV